MAVNTAHLCALPLLLDDFTRPSGVGNMRTPPIASMQSTGGRERVIRSCDPSCVPGGRSITPT
ncbi:hypothetical protein, partial [Streptomyces sp. NPDC059900]|uniref:hypothetical protein n=1 Tax=Streptomyces sp. NPDC059900 TaxID=3155816 RepID=UPI003D01B073